MCNTAGAKNQEIPRVAPDPSQPKTDLERRVTLAQWALPFLRKDVAHLQVLSSALNQLSRPMDRPLQTPRMRDHIILALMNVEKVLEEAEDLLANTERFYAGAAPDALLENDKSFAAAEEAYENRSDFGAPSVESGES